VATRHDEFAVGSHDRIKDQLRGKVSDLRALAATDSFLPEIADV
jgi:hypothetical protein